MFELPGVKPDSDVEKLFKVVGFVVLQWSVAEQALDAIVASIFRAFPNYPFVKNRPVFLKHKIKFLRQCFREIPALSDLEDASDHLLDRFEDMSRFRNDLEIRGQFT